MLTLIYRSITPGMPSTSAFCQECINAARDTLQEHDRCVAVIAKARGKTIFLEAYINWYTINNFPFSVMSLDHIILTRRYRTITHSPFIPFIILFCHTIETSSAPDLENMRRLVETLESTSSSHAQRTCDRQRRLFKALYDVAAKYVEVQSRADGQGMSWAMARQEYTDTFAGAGCGVRVGTLDPAGAVGGPGTTSVVDAQSHMLSDGGANGDGMGSVDGLGGPLGFQNAFGDGDMEMDLEGAQLWDWFNKNQSIMRMLEDT